MSATGRRARLEIRGSNPGGQLAELVPCPLELVRRLDELRIVQPSSDDGLYAAADMHLIRLMVAFEETGVELEEVARGLAAGELSFPPGVYLPERSSSRKGTTSDGP